MRTYAVESAWGAVAGLVLLQCFGVIIFNALLFHLGPSELPATDGTTSPRAQRLLLKMFLSIWGLGWACVFLMFEAMTLTLIFEFFRRKGLAALLHPFGLMSVAKLLLAVFFAKLLLMMHFDYPFPRLKGQWLTPLFLMGCLAGCALSDLRHSGSTTKVADGGGTIVGFLAGLTFFGLGCAGGELFYLLGLMGGGVLTMMTCAMLLRDDSISPESLWLCVIAATILVVTWTTRRKRLAAVAAMTAAASSVPPASVRR